MNNGNSPNDIALNAPNASLSFQTMTPTFGNIMFQIAPSETGEINYSYGNFPYLSLEALLYQQQSISQVDPTTISPGSHGGQQNITGQYTVTGAAGNVQAAIGQSSTTTGNF